MICLITGITGFVGSHMAEFLLEKGHQVHGLKRWRSPMNNIWHIQDKISLHDCDLNDPKSVFEIIRKIKPERIYHLAAQSFVPASFNNPTETLRTNIIGTANLLNAILLTEINPKIHICSSSEVYGQVLPNETPIDENNPLRPQSPYAVSKVGEDLLSQQYYRSHKLHTIITRAFTHTGPRRGDVFVESSFAKQIAMIEKGLQKPILKVGNLNSIRTFCDVRDTINAYYLVLEKGRAGEVYVVGGNETMTIGQMLDKLLLMSDIKVKVEVDPLLLRPADVTLQIPNTKKLQDATGWKPVIPVEQTLRDLLNYWREEVGD